MRSGASIRSELTANRENRSSSRRRARQRAFGIYRPLDLANQQQVQTALREAKGKVNKHFGEAANKYTELVIPEDHGVTYVKRAQVIKALKTSAMRNFSLHRVQRDVSNYNYRLDDMSPIPIEDLDWYGQDRLKLVGRFAVSGEAPEGLVEDSASISGFLDEAGAAPLEVYQPDHVTLCRFRRSRHNHSLNSEQKGVVRDIVWQELQAAKVGAVVLEEMVVANGSYREPLPVMA